MHELVHKEVAKVIQNRKGAMKEEMYLRNIKKWDLPTFDRSSDDSIEAELWLLAIKGIFQNMNYPKIPQI